jgi:hypothetical protein
MGLLPEHLIQSFGSIMKVKTRKEFCILGSCSTLKDALISSAALGSMRKVKGGPFPFERSSSSVANTSTTFRGGACSGSTGL